MSNLLSHVTGKKPVKTGGQKFDGGKPRMGLMFNDFAKSLEAVAVVSTYGEQKYGAPSGWKDVPNAPARYLDALVRHLSASSYEPLDSESGLPHLAHAAWNALAILEFAIKDEPK